MLHPRKNGQMHRYRAGESGWVAALSGVSVDRRLGTRLRGRVIAWLWIAGSARDTSVA